MTPNWTKSTRASRAWTSHPETVGHYIHRFSLSDSSWSSVLLSTEGQLAFLCPLHPHPHSHSVALYLAAVAHLVATFPHRLLAIAPFQQHQRTTCSAYPCFAEDHRWAGVSIDRSATSLCILALRSSSCRLCLSCLALVLALPCPALPFPRHAGPKLGAPSLSPSLSLPLPSFGAVVPGGVYGVRCGKISHPPCLCYECSVPIQYPISYTPVRARQ